MNINLSLTLLAAPENIFLIRSIQHDMSSSDLPLHQFFPQTMWAELSTCPLPTLPFSRADNYTLYILIPLPLRTFIIN
jgi:hypothetical protein